MITPTGFPSWLRVNDFTQYGGHLNKQNYLSRGAIDALTDVDVAQFNRMTVDLAALQRVAPFCTITFICNDSVPAAPTVEFVHMQTGITSGSYAGNSPPSGFPTLARNGNGDVSITFASSYLDSFNVTGPFSISSILPGLISTSAGTPTAERVSATVARIRAFNAAGSALSNARVTVSIW